MRDSLRRLLCVRFGGVITVKKFLADKETVMRIGLNFLFALVAFLGSYIYGSKEILLLNLSNFVVFFVPLILSCLFKNNTVNLAISVLCVGGGYYIGRDNQTMFLYVPLLMCIMFSAEVKGKNGAVWMSLSTIASLCVLIYSVVLKKAVTYDNLFINKVFVCNIILILLFTVLVFATKRKPNEKKEEYNYSKILLILIIVILISGTVILFKEGISSETTYIIAWICVIEMLIYYKNPQVMRLVEQLKLIR